MTPLTFHRDSPGAKAALHLIEHSALAGVARIAEEFVGAVYVELPDHRLAAGELALVGLLKSLTSGDLSDLAWNLDADNRRVAAEAVAMLLGVGAEVRG